MKDPICKAIFIVSDLELAQYKKKKKTFSLEDSVKINYKQCMTTGANNRLIKKFKKNDTFTGASEVLTGKKIPGTLEGHRRA